MRRTRPTPAGARAYACAVRLYPRAFREQYARGLLDVFAARQSRVAKNRQLLEKVRFWWWIVRDLLSSIPREHLASVIQRRSGRGSPPPLWKPPRGGSLRGVLSDLGVSARTLLKEPLFTANAVLTLALGIGLTTVMFCVLYGLLYRPLPVPGGDRIMHLRWTNPMAGISELGVSLSDYDEWVNQQKSFVELAAFSTRPVNLAGDERPERYEGAYVTANTFTALGVQPMLGRVFLAGENSSAAERAVVLGYHVWRDRYEQDPAVIDRSIRVNGEYAAVVGVMPEGFRFPFAQDVWIPLLLDRPGAERGAGPPLQVFGRLRDGVTLEHARTEFTGIAERLEQAYPQTHSGLLPRIEPYVAAVTGSQLKAGMFRMLVAVFLVLAVACSGVANLLLARAVTRTRITAIRTVLGASRLRTICHLLLEAALLAVMGAILGTGLAIAGVEMFDRLTAATPFPFWIVFRMDGPILLFVVGATALSAVASGLIPAIKSSGAGIAEVLKDESRGSSSFRLGRLSRFLIVGEFAVSVMLLIVVAHFIKGTADLQARDLGFATEGVLTANVELSEADFPDAQSRSAFERDLQAQLKEHPQVVSAALASVLPGLRAPEASIALHGMYYSNEQAYPRTRISFISPGFFSSLDVDVLNGREFYSDDNTNAPRVAMINASFADRFYPGEDPIGKQVTLNPESESGHWLEIVGVVPDLHLNGALEPEGTAHGVYVPIRQTDMRSMNIVLRTHGDPATLTPALRDVVATLSHNTPVSRVQTLSDAINRDLLDTRPFLFLFAGFGVAALLLAMVGLYGVVSFSVGQRTREVGLRMALGAQATSVLGRIVRGGLLQAGSGLVLGLALLALTVGAAQGDVATQGLRLVNTVVVPWDLRLILLVCAALVIVSLGATLLPARSATRVDPAEALRQD